MTPEGKVKAKVKRALDTLSNAYRFMPVQNGMGSPALDFYCCVHHVFVAIETKVVGKKLTERQRATAVQIANAGGAVFVIRDDADVAHMVNCLTRGIYTIPGLIYDTDPLCP